MTDGIIQEVFNEERKFHPFINEIINNIEIKLIGRVKEVINDNFKCACVDTDDIRRALIGDNA